MSTSVVVFLPVPARRAEFIYHAEMTATAPAPWNHTGNIFSLNIKIDLPQEQQRNEIDVDVD